MSCSLCDLNLEDIQIKDPNQPEENKYVFPLTLSNDIPIQFFSKQIYFIHLKENNCFLHIKERNDLKFFNQLHSYLLEKLYDCHDEWFEHKFERAKYDSMFKDYLFPNIEENAVNIQCNVGEDIISKLGENTSMEVYPTFKLNSIVFNNIHFQIDLELVDCVHVVANSPPIDENHGNMERSKESGIEVDLEEPAIDETLDVEAYKNNIQINKHINENREEENVVVDREKLEEVTVTPNEDVVEKIELNDEDYYILFKIIQSNIKENFSQSLDQVLKERNINTKNLDFQNIVYDSDDFEDSDDEYLNNDKFEEDYKNMV
tara:strand:- start:7610 stop:8563 length:954 start_codon:yes stop_codon:yes gene_type:complete